MALEVGVDHKQHVNPPVDYVKDGGLGSYTEQGVELEVPEDTAKVAPVVHIWVLHTRGEEYYACFAVTLWPDNKEEEVCHGSVKELCSPFSLVTLGCRCLIQGRGYFWLVTRPSSGAFLRTHLSRLT